MSQSDASQLTSNYVLSETNQSTVAGGDSARRAFRTQPTIRSFGSNSLIADDYVIQELSDVPVNASSPTHPETTVDDFRDPPNSRAIFKVNSLCVQALVYPITVVIYLLIGAAIFTAIEHDHERMAKRIAEDEIQKAIQTIARKMNLSENTTEEILSNFTYLCTDNYLQTYNAPYRWEFLPSFYFAATVITAIGEVW